MAVVRLVGRYGNGRCGTGIVLAAVLAGNHNFPGAACSGRIEPGCIVEEFAVQTSEGLCQLGGDADLENNSVWVIENVSDRQQQYRIERQRSTNG